MQVEAGGGAISAAPIATAEFAERLGVIGAPGRFIVAVSGGPDSMALARLAAAARNDVLAVTVDHGLRPDSAAEAAQAGAWCAAAGVGHKTLRWEGAKPASGVQAAARAARYRLLAGLAEREGFDAILTGHTADDQAETVFMRLARGAGPQGLAGMEAEALIAAGPGKPVRLLRPLIDFPRERVKATLAEFGQKWIDDPSNDDPLYERVRTRALLAALEEQGLLTREALLRTAARSRWAARRIDAEDERIFREAGGRFHPSGWIALERWDDVPPSLAARLVRAVSGADFAPGEEEAAAALAAAVETGASTLGGAMLKRRGGRLFFFREPAAVLGRACVAPIEPLSLGPGDRVLWDRRFIVENAAAGGAAVAVAAMGERDAAFLRSAAAEDGAPVEALKAAPWLVSGGAGTRVQSLAEERFFGRVMRFH